MFYSIILAYTLLIIIKLKPKIFIERMIEKSTIITLCQNHLNPKSFVI